jgi:hypothetical protein
MDARNAALKIIRDSGKSPYRVEKDMGRTKGYLSRVVYGNGSLRANTLVRIAEVCGYELILRSSDGTKEILITD